MGAATRRWFLQAGLTGFAGLSMAQMLELQAKGAGPSRSSPSEPKAVILFWLSGGPSHLDMWDPKPDAPSQVRGPIGTIPTGVPGVRFCEHLPRQAAIMDKLTVVRSMDCSASNHTPITMQAGNPLARRTDDGQDGAGYPAMGSVAARFRGPNEPSLPAFVGLADSWAADVWGAGRMGSAFAPVKGTELAGQFGLPAGVTWIASSDRDTLRRSSTASARTLDGGGNREGRPLRPAGRRNDQLGQGTACVRARAGRPAATRRLWPRQPGQESPPGAQAGGGGRDLRARQRRLGLFRPSRRQCEWGGIEKGLKPLLPRVDQVLATLVGDLESRGRLDSTLVVMMGEFGRSPDDQQARRAVSTGRT